MLKEKKALVINSLQELFARSSAGVLADYRGLSVSEMTKLRKMLRRSDVDYRIVKNTLARLAAERAGKDQLVGLFEGPIAVAFGHGDIVGLSKLLTKYIQETKSTLAVRGGFQDNRAFTAEDITTIARLPSREVLLGRVVGGLQGPIWALLVHLTAPVQGMVGVLQGRIRQLEGS